MMFFSSVKTKFFGIISPSREASSTPSTAKLCDLPEDILESIVGHLEPRNLEQLAQVNRQFYDIARRPTLWRSHWQNLRCNDSSVTSPQHMRAAFLRWSAPSDGEVLNSDNLGHRHACASVTVTISSVALSSYRNTEVRSLGTGEILFNYRHDNGEVMAMAATDQVLAIALGDCLIAKILSLETGQLMHTLVGHTHPVNTIAVTSDVVITGSQDETAKIWSTEHGQLLHTLAGHSGYGFGVAGDAVVTGAWHGGANIWSLQTGHVLHTLDDHTDWVTAVAATGDVGITGSSDHTAKVWLLQTGQLLHTLAGHTSGITAVAAHGDTVFTGSWDHTVKIWSLQSGSLRRTLESRAGPVLAIAAVSNLVIAGTYDGVKIWRFGPAKSQQV